MSTTEHASGGAGVLLVEDDALSRDMLSRRLGRQGFEVVTAADGFEALRALDARRFDIVLLDWMMPGMSGIEVLREIRRRHAASDVPVIMITARDASANVVEALEHGANDYVTKPVDFAVALARITVHVGLGQARAALRRSEERYALAARGANDGLWDLDVAGGVLYVSPRWQEMLGEPPIEATGTLATWLDRVHADDLGTLRAALERHLDGTTDHFEHEHRIRHADGSFRWMLCRGLAVRDPVGGAQRMAGSQTDVTARREAEDRLRRDALHDALTGLYNRRQLETELDAAMALGRRHGHALTVCLCDLDYFKQINDRHGHAAGDDVLRRFADVLRANLRGGDIAGRLGGDEFCVIFPHTRSEDAEGVIERVRAAFYGTEFRAADGSVFRATATFGLAARLDSDTTTAVLLEHADQSLYRAKELGRNRTFAPPSWNRESD